MSNVTLMMGSPVGAKFYRIQRGVRVSGQSVRKRGVLWKSSRLYDPNTAMKTASHNTTTLLYFPMTTVKDRELLVGVIFVRPSGLNIAFGDKKWFSIGVDSLGLPEGQVRWDTISVAKDGRALVVLTVDGHTVPIRSKTVRCIADPAYAAVVKARANKLRFSTEELREMARTSQPPVGFFDMPPTEAVHDAWN